MAVPRFSPSLRLRDALMVARNLRRDDDIDQVFAFEKAFADAMGTRYAVMVPSGRFGAYLALEALGIGEGDEVVLPGLTYFAVAAMVRLLGARPVFADVGEATHVLDPTCLEAAITPNTKAIVPTHLYGTPCDMDAIGAIARRRFIRVVEDCCQAAGARHRGRIVGSLGIAGFFTFGITKNMTTLTGGMVTTHDRQVAEHIRSRVDPTELLPRAEAARAAITGAAMRLATRPGLFDAFVHPFIRAGTLLGTDPIDGAFGEPEALYEELPASFHHARPRAVQALVGQSQLARLDRLNAARRSNGERLTAQLQGTRGLTLPSTPPGSEPIFMSYVVEHDDRNAFIRQLHRQGIDTTTGFMSDLANHPLLPESRADCPNARRAIERMVHLPVHPALSERQVDRIADAVRASVTP